MPRKAFPADEKGQHKVVTKTITAGDVAESGKLHPARGLPGGSGVAPKKDKVKLVPQAKADEEMETHEVQKSIYVPLIKANNEEQTVTGIVLQPEVVDAQGDIMDKAVIKKAAHTFVAKYNKATKLGLMHKYFGKQQFELLESWIAPHDVVINNMTVKEGSWIMTVKVTDAKVWKLVKEGKLKGFSIGGKAKVQKLAA
jgi:hypothetical protein